MRQFQFCIASAVGSPVKGFHLGQLLLRIQGVDDRPDLLLQVFIGLPLDKETFSVPLESRKRFFQLHVIVAQQGEDLNHPGRGKEGGEKFVEGADGILRLFQLGVTDGHLELGLVVKGTLREVGDQAFESPEGSLRVAL